MTEVASAPLVSVVILNYNGAAHLPECLMSLSQQDYSPLEIIVADNASSDASREICTGFPVQFLALPDNYGFGRGNNEGAAAARGDYLFFVNNDMRFAPDLVSVLVREAEKDPTIFALDVKQYDWSGKRAIHTALKLKRTVDPRAAFAPFVGFEQYEARALTPVPFANGANFFCRRWMFDELGGFDPTFFIDHEDQDLGWRAWLRGWKTLYVPQAICWHKVGMSFDAGAVPASLTSPWARRRYTSSERNRIRFVMKTAGVALNAATFFAQHATAVAYLVALRPFQARTALRAYWGNVRDWRTIRAQRRAALGGATTSSSTLLRQFASA